MMVSWVQCACLIMAMLLLHLHGYNTGLNLLVSADVKKTNFWACKLYMSFQPMVYLHGLNMHVAHEPYHSFGSYHTIFKDVTVTVRNVFKSLCFPA